MKESLKPIEPGCLVLVFVTPTKPPWMTGGPKAGDVHTVKERIPTVEILYPLCQCGKSDGHWWAMEDDWIGAYAECTLLRIDPDDEIREDETQMTDVAT